MKLRKLFAAGLALVMTLAMAAPAFAADDASITIDPNTPATGSSAGETYTAYKIFDASFEGDSNKPGSVSYTIDASNPFFNAVKDFELEGQKVFELVQVNASNTYIVKVLKKDFTEDKDAAALATALNAVTGKVAAGTAVADGNNKFVIAGLDKGYYMVTSSLGTKIIVETLGKTEVDTKNQYPTMTKVVDKSTADYGETVTYTIAVTIPATAAGQIVVHDSLATALTYVDMTAVTGITKQDSTCKDACSFEFVLSEDYVAANLGKTVNIVYTAKLNGNVATATAHDNSAWLTYAAYTSAKETASVKTFEINVYKYTEKEGVKTGLPGAGFVLMNAAGKYYAIDTDGNVSWVDIANATEYSSDENGNVPAFKGLANGTYTLVEKTVPTNYNPAQNVEIKVENANPGQVEVLNQTGIALPSTGGMGTTLFYIVGGLMVVCAGVVLVTKKRMGNK